MNEAHAIICKDVNTLGKLNSVRALDEACGIKVAETICKVLFVSDV
jgi:hypothetical protein